MKIMISLWHRSLFGILAVLVLGFALVGCAGSSKKKEQPAEEKGTLSRTFTLVDDQGRNSGTLTLDPFGGAVLHDANGNTIGKFKSEGPSEAQPSETPSESEPSEAKPNIEATD